MTICISMEKFLIDTHVLIWLVSDSKKISKKAFLKLNHRETKIYISTVSLWEIAIKEKIGKLDLGLTIEELILELKFNKIEIFTINTNHIKALNSFKLHHRDPFDRMLIAQAKVENMTIITKDNSFSKYNIDILW